MKKQIMNWYNWMPYLSLVYAMLLVFFYWSFSTKLLIGSLIVIHLHFFEEFGLPGGFAWCGIKVEMKNVNKNVSKWQLNQASALFGNLWFAGFVYLLALVLPSVKWLVASAVMFSFVEVLMHFVIFNISLKKFYNPGLVTAALGLMPISIVYLMNYQFNLVDVIIGFVWIGINYWIAFRSPLFQFINNMKQFTFTKMDVAKSKKYMDTFNVSIDDYHFK